MRWTDLLEDGHVLVDTLRRVQDFSSLLTFCSLDHTGLSHFPF